MDDDPYLAELLELTNDELGPEPDASAGGGGDDHDKKPAASPSPRKKDGAAAAASSSSLPSPSPSKAASYRASGTQAWMRVSESDVLSQAHAKPSQAKPSDTQCALHPHDTHPLTTPPHPPTPRRYAPRDAQAALVPEPRPEQAALGGRGPRGLSGALWRAGRPR